jgi:hypothetical protein
MPVRPRPRRGAAFAVPVVAALLAAACAQRASEVPEALAIRAERERRATSTSTTTTTTAATTTVPPTTVPFDVHALRPPAPAGEPGGLAAQITEAERVLRDPAAPPPAVGTAALAQQVAYRQLGDHPEWDAAVLAAVPADLQWAVGAHAAARRSFMAMHRRFATTLPAWRIVPPAPVEELQALYLEAEQAFGVPWPYLAAINLVETAMGRIRGTSVAGAQGPMQFMPATWAAYGGGGDINAVRDSILAAGRYLAANRASTDIRNALWNYNHSHHYVDGVLRYAELVAEHPGGLRALYHWGVFYRTASGDVYLPVGYEASAPVPVP